MFQISNIVKLFKKCVVFVVISVTFVLNFIMG